MRALTALSVSVLAGCLATPPSVADPDAGFDADCTRYGFATLDGLYATADEGCRLTIPDRLSVVQESDVAYLEGCYVEPVTYFAVESLQVEYGAESDMAVALVMYRISDGESLQVNRTGDTFYLLVLDALGDVLTGQSTTFDPGWTLWRLEVAGGMVAASAGPSREELAEVMEVPFSVEPQMGIVLGAWPGALPGGEREVSFDDLEICPPP